MHLDDQVTYAPYIGDQVLAHALIKADHAGINRSASRPNIGIVGPMIADTSSPPEQFRQHSSAHVRRLANKVEATAMAMSVGG